MHIALDARAWNWTGIGRYIRSLTKEYLKDSQGHQFTLLVPNGEEEVIREELGDSSNRFRYIGVEPSYYSLKEQTIFLQQLNALHDVDLVHFAHFNVPVLYTKPFVVTIHDVTRFIFPGQKKQSLIHQLAYEYVFSKAVQHAKKVIAVSNTTAHDMKLLPSPAGGASGKVEVIYEGVDEKFFEEVSEDQRTKLREYLHYNGKYIVFVGVWMSHKNIFRLIDAFASVIASDPNLKLVITGKYQQGYSDLVGYVKRNSLEGAVLFPGFVPDELLPALYAEAAAMVFPSLYEGYGLPPLEAAACGTPVVASNVSSMPELLQGGAEYVNPESVEDITHGIRAVITDSLYASRLADEGRRIAGQYHMNTMAKAHIRTYENALQ